jgi:hypothetical protein
VTRVIVPVEAAAVEVFVVVAGADAAVVPGVVSGASFPQAARTMAAAPSAAMVRARFTRRLLGRRR